MKKRKGKYDSVCYCLDYVHNLNTGQLLSPLTPTDFLFASPLFLKGEKMFSLLIVSGVSSCSVLTTALFLEGAFGASDAVELIRLGVIKIVHIKKDFSEAFDTLRKLPQDGTVGWIGSVSSDCSDLVKDFFRVVGDRLLAVYDEHEDGYLTTLVGELNLTAPVFVPDKTMSTYSIASLMAGNYQQASGSSITDRMALLRDAGDWIHNRQISVSDEARELGFSVSAVIMRSKRDSVSCMVALLHLLGDKEGSQTFNIRLKAAAPVYQAVDQALSNAQMQGQVMVVRLVQKRDVPWVIFDFDYVKAVIGDGEHSRAPFKVIIFDVGNWTEGGISVEVNQEHTILGQTNLIQVLFMIQMEGVRSEVFFSGIGDLNFILEQLNALV